MSQLRSDIPFMASLWIRSGYDVKVEVSAQTYQVGLILKLSMRLFSWHSLKSWRIFFPFRVSQPPCALHALQKSTPERSRTEKWNWSIPLYSLQVWFMDVEITGIWANRFKTQWKHNCAKCALNCPLVNPRKISCPFLQHYLLNWSALKKSGLKHFFWIEGEKIWIF